MKKIDLKHFFKNIEEWNLMILDYIPLNKQCEELLLHVISIFCQSKNIIVTTNIVNGTMSLEIIF